MLEQEARQLRARVVELELRLASLEARFEALATLADRIIVFLKTAHDPRLPEFRHMEEAAEEALRPS